jgi:hypothetical protein
MRWHHTSSLIHLFIFPKLGITYNEVQKRN